MRQPIRIGRFVEGARGYKPCPEEDCYDRFEKYLYAVVAIGFAAGAVFYICTGVLFISWFFF